MTVETYEPITRWHIRIAVTTIALACVAVLLGPIVMEQSGLHSLRSYHALIGVTAVSLWIVQGGLGWLLWSEKEKVRKWHRYNGFAVLGLALLQVPFGLSMFYDFWSHN
jgi:hypothetical protein